MATLKDRIQQMDEAIRRGALASVKAELLRTSAKRATREQVLALSNLARRAGAPGLAVRFLQPLVRPKTAHARHASVGELASYASSLAAIGAVSEALAVVKALDLRKIAQPEVSLSVAFIHVHHWDYPSALPIFEHYLTFDQLSLYQRCVGRLNLGLCLGFAGSSGELSKLATELVETSAQNGWHLMTREAHLFAAQAAILSRDWSAARISLERAFEVSKRVGLSDFFVRKWNWVLDLHQNGLDAQLRARKEDLVQEGVQRNAWEGVRDLDYHHAVVGRDAELLERVFFGSPFPSYRRRIMESVGDWHRLPKSYVWQPRREAGAEIDFGSLGFELDAKLLQLLGSDFYRPFKLGSIFSALYPETIFDPLSSPARVRAVVKRARGRCEQQEYPLSIAFAKNEYRLSADADVSIRIHLSYDRDAGQVHLQNLEQAWPYRAFSTDQAAHLLALSTRQTRELLNAFVEGGRLIRVGRGRGTTFRFAERG